MDKLDIILVKRLHEFIDPWWMFDICQGDIDIAPIVSVFSEERDDYYHIGRIRFFRDELLAGKAIEHIVLDCVCNRGYVYPEPVIIDGWHRFAACVNGNIPCITASFSGRVDLLDYLTGKSNKKPEG